MGTANPAKVFAVWETGTSCGKRPFDLFQNRGQAIVGEELLDNRCGRALRVAKRAPRWKTTCFLGLILVIAAGHTASKLVPKRDALERQCSTWNASDLNLGKLAQPVEAVPRGTTALPIPATKARCKHP